MTEKLTLEWCFKYPKAKLKYDTACVDNISFDESKATGRGIITVIKIVNDDIQVGDNGTIAWVDLIDCKLILRPLSSLTDEERHYIGKKFIPFEIKEFEWMDVKDYIRVLYSHNILDFVDYLRSINIDIDGLQERGIAIFE